MVSELHQIDYFSRLQERKLKINRFSNSAQRLKTSTATWLVVFFFKHGRTIYSSTVTASSLPLYPVHFPADDKLSIQDHNNNNNNNGESV